MKNRIKITKKDLNIAKENLNQLIDDMFILIDQIKKKPGMHTEGSYHQIVQIAMQAASQKTRVTALNNFLNNYE